jgi:hypothetical protein
MDLRPYIDLLEDTDLRPYIYLLENTDLRSMYICTASNPCPLLKSVFSNKSMYGLRSVSSPQICVF